MGGVKEQSNDMERLVLSAMREAEAPLGAGALREMLALRGFETSEAGIGRALRALRQRGLLERRGFQGHVVTEAGEARLEQLNGAKLYGDMLRDLMEKNSLAAESVIDILVARRALEREAAYQAALKATEEDIEGLRAIIALQYENMEKNENFADLSTAFHLKVFEIARSPVLSGLYNLIGLSVQWQDFFIGTFKMYNQPVNVSHEKIMEAIRARDPEKASELMGRHLTNVIENARRLCVE